MQKNAVRVACVYRRARSISFNWFRLTAALRYCAPVKIKALFYGNIVMRDVLPAVFVQKIVRPGRLLCRKMWRGSTIRCVQTAEPVRKNVLVK